MSQPKVKAGGYHREALDTTWRTPERILERVRVYFGGPVPFDPATGPENPTRAERFCTGDLPPPAIASEVSLFPTPPEDLTAEQLRLSRACGLATSWDWPTWVNPPYGAETRAWLTKMETEGARGVVIVALLPCARWETDYFQRMLRGLRAVCLIRGRVAFVSSQDGQAVAGNTSGSMILGWNVDLARFAEAFEPLGACFEWRALVAAALGGRA